MSSENGDSEGYAEYMVRGGGIAIVFMAVTFVAGLFVRMIMARSLPVHEYGLFFAIMTFLGFLTILQGLGTGGALVRYISEFMAEERLERAKSVFSSGFTLQAIFTGALCVIIFALAEWLSSSFFGDPGAKLILILMLAWFGIMMPMRLLSDTCRGLKDIPLARAPEPVRMGSTLAVVSLFVYLGFNSIEMIALAFILGAVTSMLLSYFAFRRRHPGMIGSPSPNLKDSKMLLTFGMFMILGAAAWMVIQRTDTLMLTALRPLKDVGFYQAARPLSNVMNWAGIAIAVPLLPVVSELWARGEEKRLRLSLGMLTKFAFILVIPTALIFIAFPDIVLRLLFGLEYVAASNALRILGIGMIFLVGSSAIATGITGAGRPELNARALGIAACFNVVANYLLIPQFGAGGAAVATSLSFLLILVLRFHYIRRIMEFSVPTIDILKAFVAGGISLMAIWLLKSAISLNPWLELFAVIIPCLFLYLLLICRIGVLKKEDIETLRRIIPGSVVGIIEALM